MSANDDQPPVDEDELRKLADIVPIGSVKRVGMSTGGELHQDADDVVVLRQLVKQAVEERAESVSRIDALERALRAVLGTEWLPGTEADLLALCVATADRANKRIGRIDVLEDALRAVLGRDHLPESEEALSRTCENHVNLYRNARACADRHLARGAEFESGGNAGGAAELRRVGNLLYALLDGRAGETVL